MNELQPKTIKLEPAKVEFNYKELEERLAENLQKYQNLTFTEETATECRSTIAELRKGKKAVDEYRKKIKKQLTEPVTEFEDKCKELNKKFDEVINPLVEQHEEFEENRRNEKRKKVEEELAQIIEEFELEQKYAVRLEILDSYLTKSKTMKSIREELESNAQMLKMEQEKEENDKQLVINAVKLANAENGLNLAESAYVNLLEFQNAADIQKQIESDAEKEVHKREEKEQAEKEKQIANFEPTPAETENISFSDPEAIADPFASLEDGLMEDPFVVKESEYEVTYKVRATNGDLQELQNFMKAKGIMFEVIFE